jgi:hypothetical protein
VVVFLEVRPRDRTLTTTAQWQGKFTVVRRDGGQEIAIRHDPQRPDRGVYGDDVRPLATWLTELRQLIRDAPQSASNVAIQPVPVEAAQAVPWSVNGNGAAISASWRDSRVNQQAVRVDLVAPGQPGLPDGGEPQLRAGADFWIDTGLIMFAPGGLQSAGCFIAREPDGRVTVGPDACG